MSEIVITDAHIEINSVDESEHIDSITLQTSAEIQQSTAFGDDWHTRVGGLKDFSLGFDFNNDFSSAGFDSRMFALLGESASVKIRPTSAAVSATNPEYRGNAILDSYPPFGTAVGELVEGSTNMVGNGPLTRHTS